MDDFSLMDVVCVERCLALGCYLALVDAICFSLILFLLLRFLLFLCLNFFGVFDNCVSACLKCVCVFLMF